MKTCYDCIHCEACSDAGDNGFSSLKEDVSKCKHFKNKADVVEVVRCKDCTRYHAPFCFHPEGLHQPKENDFCSYAKRKEVQQGGENK